MSSRSVSRWIRSWKSRSSLRVESGSRLVEEQELGTPDDPHRDVEASRSPPERVRIFWSACSSIPTSLMS